VTRLARIAPDAAIGVRIDPSSTRWVSTRSTAANPEGWDEASASSTAEGSDSAQAVSQSSDKSTSHR
jgi:hypothetical protein